MKKSRRVRMVLPISIGALLIITGIAFSEGSSKNLVLYPEGYRNWTHIKSMVIQQGHPLYESFGGIHHI